MRSRVFRLARQAVLLAAVALVTLLLVRAWDTQRGPALDPWHTFVPEELDVAAIDAADWDGYLAHEEMLFAAVRAEVIRKLEPEDRVPYNRYFVGSPVHPESFTEDWNRSYVIEPQGEAAGAVVLLHGLTDSPYSLRHVARRYRDHGFVAVAIRLPAHGTVPGALTEVGWQEWTAATRLAVREARRRAGPTAPLHLAGFSNGGALALKHALDALDDPGIGRPDRIVLISPMIGITAFARFAGFAALPAILPAFAKAAWLGIVPEFNPFKYNSFPVNGARQSHLVTAALQQQVARRAREGGLEGLPPILTFQSVVDFTVSTPAVVTALYAHLPDNGSELVLFDLNRSSKFGPLLRAASETALDRILPPAPRRFRATIVTNEGSATGEVSERVMPAGESAEKTRALGLAYPREVFSLSHVALPFPIGDPLYGLEPESEEFGINLGAIATRGERGVLIVSLDALQRLSSNPFFPYMIERIAEGIGAPVLAVGAAR